MVVEYFNPWQFPPHTSATRIIFTVQDRLATAQVEVSLADLETARYRYSAGKLCDAYDLLTRSALTSN